MMGSRFRTAHVLLLVFASSVLRAQDEEQIEAPPSLSPATTVKWRSVGPAVMSGRIVDIAIPSQDPNLIFVAAASGGIFKSKNCGTTWSPVFDQAPLLSIGDLDIAPSNPSILYAGTGEANNQRSSYYGDGVYKSTDCGVTWNYVGLRESHHIGRIVIHPTNPDVVFVAALGRLYSSNKDRGLYRTLDGGATWDCVQFVDENTGFVDVVIDPVDPQKVYAASYQRRRRPWHFTESGEGSAIWKSSDGGSTFERLSSGLPSGEIGRIGLAISATDPKLLVACVENRNPQSRAEVEAESESEGEDRRRDGRDAVAAGESEAKQEEEPAAGGFAAPKIVGGEIYRSEDGGATWKRINKKSVSGEPPYYYGQIRIDPKNSDRLWLLGVQLFVSEDGGVTWKNDGARGIHVDHHALWIDPDNSDHLVLGNDGGLAVSYDRGKNWDVYDNLPLSQFYTVAVDARTPYWIYGGLQDNGTYGFPSIGESSTGIGEAECVRVGGGDGFYVAINTEEPDVVFHEMQFGGVSALNLFTGKRWSARPPKTKGEPALRWNWNTPIVHSPHNPRILYVGSQHLHRSLDRGRSWERLSADLTSNDAEKIKGNVPHCTITTISESPLRAGVLWVGTDDGRVQLTQDGGLHWRDVMDHLPSKVRGLWVSRVLASAHDRAKAYVSFSGYREDLATPLLFVTDDYGGNWSELSLSLPAGAINSVIEDPKNSALLFVAQDSGVSVSLDGGESFETLSSGMPRVPVHDLALQLEASELVAATHGRGMYVAPISVLREWSSKVRESKVHLFSSRAVVRRGPNIDRGFRGARFYEGKNPEFGVAIDYWFSATPTADVSLEIQDVAGRRVRRLSATKARGFQRTTWDLRGNSGSDDQRPTRPRQRGLRGGGTVPEGDYVIVLRVGDEEFRRPVHVPDSVPAPRVRGGGEEGELH